MAMFIILGNFQLLDCQIFVPGLKLSADFGFPLCQVMERKVNKLPCLPTFYLIRWNWTGMELGSLKIYCFHRPAGVYKFAMQRIRGVCTNVGRRLTGTSRWSVPRVSRGWWWAPVAGQPWAPRAGAAGIAGAPLGEKEGPLCWSANCPRAAPFRSCTIPCPIPAPLVVQVDRNRGWSKFLF